MDEDDFNFGRRECTPYLIRGYFIRLYLSIPFNEYCKLGT